MVAVCECVAAGWLEPPIGDGTVAAEIERLCGLLSVSDGDTYICTDRWRSGLVRVIVGR